MAISDSRQMGVGRSPESLYLISVFKRRNNTHYSYGAYHTTDAAFVVIYGLRLFVARELFMFRRITGAFRDAMYGRLPQEREEGQGMAEYGFILSGVALLAIIAVFLLGPQIGRMLNKV